jgi:hypothetical protein
MVPAGVASKFKQARSGRPQTGARVNATRPLPQRPTPK